MLKQLLEETGKFNVEINNAPEVMNEKTLENVDVILSNWNSFGKDVKVTKWSDETNNAFMKFIKTGGGFVVVHAGGTCFHDWKEFQQLIGATWGIGPVWTGHGPVHDFEVELETPHAITAGIAPKFKVHDELWHNMAVGGEMTVLATAFSSKDQKWNWQKRACSFCYRNG